MDEGERAEAGRGNRTRAARPKLFVNTGDNIEIDTRTGEYRRRV